MLDVIFDNVLLNTLSSLSTFFIIFDVTIYIFDLRPMNSTVGVLDASSLNLPMTFSLVLS